MSIAYLDLTDYLAVAVEVTGLSSETIARVANLDLADSALHAPAGGFGDTEFYPDFIDKADLDRFLAADTASTSAVDAPSEDPAFLRHLVAPDER